MPRIIDEPGRVKMTSWNPTSIFSSQRKSDKAAAPFCNPWRTVAEILVIVLLCSWGLTYFIVNRLRVCQPGSHALNDDSGIIEIVATLSDLAWTVDDGGVITLASTDDVPAAKRAFHIEWHQEQADFCLRWLGDMRVLESVPAGQRDAFVLRTGGYSCDHATQYFKQSGGSLYSVGAQSLVNVRDSRFVRTHGDNRPWGPLLKETSRTRMVFQALPHMRSAYEAGLLGLVRHVPPTATLNGNVSSTRGGPMPLLRPTV